VRYTCVPDDTSRRNVIEPICILQETSTTLVSSGREDAYHLRKGLDREYMYAETQKARHFVDLMLPQSQALLGR
jgi:hypothetical protein